MNKFHYLWMVPMMLALSALAASVIVLMWLTDKAKAIGAYGSNVCLDILDPDHR